MLSSQLSLIHRVLLVNPFPLVRDSRPWISQVREHRVKSSKLFPYRVIARYIRSQSWQVWLCLRRSLTKLKLIQLPPDLGERFPRAFVGW